MSRRALATYEALSLAHPGDLMARSGLSEAVTKVGYYQVRTGAMGASLETTRQAVRLAEDVVCAAPSDEMYRSRLATQLATLGNRLVATGRMPESLPAYSAPWRSASNWPMSVRTTSHGHAPSATAFSRWASRIV